MPRTALIVVVLATAGLLLTGCGQQEQVQDAETAEETASEETTAGQTSVEETTQQETTAASDSEQVAKVEVETTPPAQAATPSNGESQPSLGANEAGQAVSSPPESPPVNSIVFVPLGNGVTYSCTGGPPFIHYGHDASTGNCAVQHVLPPVGLVCDVPTSITIAHDMEQLVFDGSICHSGADTSLADPETTPPVQAQPYPFGTEPAPYSFRHQH